MQHSSYPSSLQSQIHQFNLQLGQLQVNLGSLAKQMNSPIPNPSSLPPLPKLGLFNVKTVVTQNCDQQTDLEESKIIENSFVARMNVFKFKKEIEKKEITILDKREQSRGKDKRGIGLTSSRERLDTEKRGENEVRKKSVQRMHQSQPKKQPVPFNLSTQMSKNFKGQGKYTYTSQSQPAQKESLKYIQKQKDRERGNKLSDWIDKKLPTVEFEEKKKGYPHINLTLKQSSPDKKKVIYLGRRAASVKKY